MERPSELSDAFARLRGFARDRDPRIAGFPNQSRREAESSRSAAAIFDAPATARPPQPIAAPHGRCELCSLPLAEMHRHLFETTSRDVVCACDGCAYTFQGVAGSRYKPVPRDARELDADVAFHIPWEQLSLPINLAFFVRDGESGELSGYYPSPGGVTKSALPFDALNGLLAGAENATSLEDDVEALLVNRLTQKTEVFVVPIDRCYELAGLIRLHWRGFSGGEDMRREMEAFFNGLRSTARPTRSARGAAD